MGVAVRGIPQRFLSDTRGLDIEGLLKVWLTVVFHAARVATGSIMVMNSTGVSLPSTR